MKQRMSRKKKDTIHKEAMERWTLAYDAEENERNLMNEDRLFCQTEDGQWQDINNGDSEDDGKPRFTVNKIATEIQKVFGNYLQLRPQGKLIPAVMVQLNSSLTSEVD